MFGEKGKETWESLLPPPPPPSPPPLLHPMKQVTMFTWIDFKVTFYFSASGGGGDSSSWIHHLIKMTHVALHARFKMTFILSGWNEKKGHGKLYLSLSLSLLWTRNAQSLSGPFTCIVFSSKKEEEGEVDWSSVTSLSLSELGAHDDARDDKMCVFHAILRKSSSCFLPIIG